MMGCIWSMNQNESDAPPLLECLLLTISYMMVCDRQTCVYVEVVLVIAV